MVIKSIKEMRNLEISEDMVMAHATAEEVYHYKKRISVWRLNARRFFQNFIEKEDKYIFCLKKNQNVKFNESESVVKAERDMFVYLTIIAERINFDFENLKFDRFISLFENYVDK